MRTILILTLVIAGLGNSLQTVKEEKTFKKEILKRQRQIEKHTKGCGMEVYRDSLEDIRVHFYKSKELTMKVSIYNSSTKLMTYIYFFKGNPIYERIPTKDYVINLFFDNGDLIYCDKVSASIISKASSDLFSNYKNSEVPKTIFIKDKIKSNFFQ